MSIVCPSSSGRVNAGSWLKQGQRGRVRYPAAGPVSVMMALRDSGRPPGASTEELHLLFPYQTPAAATPNRGGGLFLVGFFLGFQWLRLGPPVARSLTSGALERRPPSKTSPTVSYGVPPATAYSYTVLPVLLTLYAGGYSTTEHLSSHPIRALSLALSPSHGHTLCSVWMDPGIAWIAWVRRPSLPPRSPRL